MGVNVERDMRNFCMEAVKQLSSCMRRDWATSQSSILGMQQAKANAPGAQAVIWGRYFLR
ncbi:hypothetical protein FH972_009552 [Carpinus fangiana]|uniref:Uncharacterized protein n=1 Tax=Carpinus fangiana TaxID=176857 RepID=A0A660KMK0_9ROSI|nr:hypothetical protein FH972_009552 [Carpinus fangiana]